MARDDDHPAFMIVEQDRPGKAVGSCLAGPARFTPARFMITEVSRARHGEFEHLGGSRRDNARKAPTCRNPPRSRRELSAMSTLILRHTPIFRPEHADLP